MTSTTGLNVHVNYLSPEERIHFNLSTPKQVRACERKMLKVGEAGYYFNRIPPGPPRRRIERG